LWQMTGELRRYEPALFIKRRLQIFFKYLILDEIHEEKGADTAQGHAAGALVSRQSSIDGLRDSRPMQNAHETRCLLTHHFRDDMSIEDRRDTSPLSVGRRQHG